MKEYRFRYGDGEVVIPLDEGQVLGELHGNHVPAAASIPDTLRAALENPIGLPPLRQWTKPGERVAQLCIAPVYTAAFVQADALDETARGEGGFGSTGK